MYTADSGNLHPCAHTAHHVRNFGLPKVDMKVAIRHSRDLVYLAKGFAPPLDGFQTRIVVESDSANNELLSAGLATNRGQGHTGSIVPTRVQNMRLGRPLLFNDCLICGIMRTRLRLIRKWQTENARFPRYGAGQARRARKVQ